MTGRKRKYLLKVMQKNNANQLSVLQLKEYGISTTPVRRVSSRNSPSVPDGTLSNNLESSKKKLKLSHKNSSSTAKMKTKEIIKKKVGGKGKSNGKTTEDQMKKKNQKIGRNNGDNRIDEIEGKETTESRRIWRKVASPDSGREGRPSRAAAVAAAAAIVESRKYI